MDGDFSVKEMLKTHMDKEDNDFDDFRKTLRNFVLANISFLIGAGIWVGTIQTQAERNKQDIEMHIRRVESIEEKVNRTDVTQAQIQTKLSGIEAILIELKADLKRIR